MPNLILDCCCNVLYFSSPSIFFFTVKSGACPAAFCDPPCKDTLWLRSVTYSCWLCVLYNYLYTPSHCHRTLMTVCGVLITVWFVTGGVGTMDEARTLGYRDGLLWKAKQSWSSRAKWSLLEGPALIKGINNWPWMTWCWYSFLCQSVMKIQFLFLQQTSFHRLE